jgi:N-acetyl-gamma-glutamyl-phosphate reductase
MTSRVFIDGQSGTTGIGIAERLREIPGIAVHALPHHERRSPDARQAAMQAADLVILCLPDDAARESAALAQALGDDAPKILDASTAHRIAPGWVYGFAELWPDQPDKIARAGRVANPGCYATGAIALLRPLVAEGLVPADAPLSINAVSGYSGGGKAMIAAHEADGGPAFELYGLNLAHKHIPEIVTHAGLARAPIFVPSVAHVRQGMVVSIPLHLDLLPAGVTAAHLVEAFADFYADYRGNQGQVRVAPPAPDGRLVLDGLADTDGMELSVYAREDLRMAVLVARLDNLGKGASGAAVQNTKLMLGLKA